LPTALLRQKKWASSFPSITDNSSSSRKADVHNVIVCTLCSCTAYTIIGAAPDWYKDLDYRARVVRESRTVLGEMGLDLPSSTEIRVWDTTADHRYMVLPVQPPATIGWPEEKLAKIVTQDSMIGASRLQEVTG
jgi:nitrile hydratase subunit alpha